MTTFVLFDSFKEKVMTGNANLSSTMRCALLSGTAALNIDTSTVASVTALWATSASGGQADRLVNPASGGTLADQVTKVAAGAIRFDLSDVAFTATTGQNLNVGRGFLYIATAGGNIPVGWWQISTAEVAASQFVVQWPSTGIFETSDNA